MNPFFHHEPKQPRFYLAARIATWIGIGLFSATVWYAVYEAIEHAIKGAR